MDYYSVLLVGFVEVGEGELIWGFGVVYALDYEFVSEVKLELLAIVSVFSVDLGFFLPVWE